MTKSKTSKRWLREHFDDKYVKQSQEDGYRSRASYKLLELHKKDKLIRPGMTVLDLGAAPGGWSQVVAELNRGGRVIATDILAMDGLADVEFLQGDFTEQEVYDKILSSLGDHKADLVLSDMAPNMSGMKGIDQPKAMYLAELALEMAINCLHQDGVFLVKVFQGEGLEQYQADMKAAFHSVKARKPDSSRARSREFYLLASGLRVSRV